MDESITKSDKCEAASNGNGFYWYGENKEGIPVALLDTGEEYYGDPVVEKVGDLEFRYEGLNRIWLVYDKFYTISDAYEAGILTDSDVARIYSLHNSGQEG